MASILFQRVKSLCEENNITFSELENILNFSSSLIKKWEKGTSPTVDKIIRIAEYFNVSTDYLLGKTDIKNPIDDIVEDKNVLLLMKLVQDLNEENTEKLIKMTKLMFNYKSDINE